MSTRARIGILLEDNSILSVYHHWDGYPDGLGAKLAAEYNTKEKAAELIDGGDISTCMARSNWKGVSSEEEFVLYYSERGDEDIEPTLAENDFEFLQQTRKCDGEYAYVFNTFTNRWNCYDLHAGDFVNLYQKELANA